MVKINFSGIIISVIFLLLVGVKYFFNLKPKFLLPGSAFEHTLRGVYRILMGVIVCCVVLLPLNIQILESKQLVEEQVLPIQVLFDVSLSMAADDIEPSRFIAAKEAFAELVMGVEGYTVSLIAFSKIPFVWIPFSQDTAAVLQKWETTSLADFPPVQEFVGTAIGDALLLGMENLEQFAVAEEFPGVIVLFTDGDSHEGTDPYEVLPLLQQKGIPVYVFGIGEQNFVIGVDHQGAAIQARVNIELLEDIAEETGGKFYRILDAESFTPFVEEIAGQVKSVEQQQVQEVYFPINKLIFWILGMALFVWGIWFGIGYVRK